MTRLPALSLGLLLVGLLSCSRQANLKTEAVGKWKLVRQSGKPVSLPKGATGVIELRPDGTITYEEITEISVNNKLDSLNVKHSQGKYRFLDGENIEIEGEDRGQTKKWTVKLALKDNVLTLHKPYGQVDDFERVP